MPKNVRFEKNKKKTKKQKNPQHHHQVRRVWKTLKSIIKIN